MKNLFDEDVDIRTDLEKDLSDYDAFTFQVRAKRLKYLDSVYPTGYGMMGLEMYYLFTEARYCYINGQFVATILLAQSLIEQWLSGVLREKGYAIKEGAGLSEIINVVRKHQIMHQFLIDKVDSLRKIRNPFVHLKPMLHPDTLDFLSINQGINHITLAEKDAQNALALMYEIVQRAGDIPVKNHDK